MQASSSYQPQFSPVIQLSYTADALQAPQPLQQQLQQQQVQVQPQPQPQQPQSQSDIILQGLWDELQRLMDGQSVLLKAPTPEGCKELAAAHASLAQRIAALYDDVTSLWAGTVLQPQDLPKARDTMQELAVVERQLTVLRTELEAITTAVTTTTTAGDPTQEGMRAMRPGMALAIQRQPFPQVFRKGEMLTESDYIVVKLIPSCLAMNCASVVSQVRAQVVSDPTPTSPMTSSSTSSSSSSSSSSLSPSPGGSCASGHNSPLSSSSTPMAATSLFTPTATLSSSPPGVTNGSGSGGSGGGKVPVTHELIQPVAVSLDPVTLTARFPLRFLDGTKNAPVALRFSLQMVVNGTTPVTVESELSAPFVVMTHKDQWKGAAGTMFKRESYFFANTEVPWALVANVLQAQFLRATKQAIPAEVHRPLSEFDLTYLSKRFFGGRAVVDQHQFDIFWEWFGTTMDTLRHQRPVLALWWQGLVYGFASKEDVEVALRNEAPGTFIIRFSETFPGSFAIAYATAEGVKHYHVTPQDHALHKTLPDFIVYHPQFKNVLQLQSSQDPTTGQSVLQLVRVDKNAAFESFCSKKTAQPRPIVPGYSLLM